MSIKKLILALLLAVTPVFAQTHTYPALDTNNTFTGANTFAWTNTTTYPQGIIVTYNGVLYVSLQNSNLAQTPNTATAWWAPVANNLNPQTNPSVILHVNSNSNYAGTPDGTTQKPFTTIAAAFAAMTSAIPYGLSIDDGLTHTESISSGPSAPTSLTIYGNQSTVSNSSAITFSQPVYAYGVNITATAGVTVPAGSVPSVFSGGTFNGIITIGGNASITNSQFINSSTINVAASSLLSITETLISGHVVGGSGAQLAMSHVQMANSSFSNDINWSAGGKLTVIDSSLSQSNHSAPNILCTGSGPNYIGDIVQLDSGIQCGSVATYVSPSAVVPSYYGGTNTNVVALQCTGNGGAQVCTTAGTVAAAVVNDVAICPTTKTFAQCAALLPSGGTLQFLAGTYTSGQSSCLSTSNLVIQGEGMPEFNSGYTALMGGTIIKGGVSICASNVTVQNMGFDTGSAYIGGGGTAADGLAFCGASCSNPSDPILQGATIQNVSSLNNSASAAFHAIRVEHYNDVKIHNIKAVYGTHGVAIKSDGVQASKIFSAGHSTDDIIVKSDGYTTTQDVQLSDLLLGAIATGDTTSGIVIDAEAAAVVSRIHISGLSAVGLPYGVYFLNNSTFGIGSINSVTLSHASIYQTHIPSVTSSGIGFSGSSGTVEYSLLDDLHIINGAGSDANNAFLMYATMNHSTISNVYSYNQRASSFLQGANLSIKGWEDSGSQASIPTFTSTISGTTVLVTGYTSFGGNAAATTSNGAVIQVNGISLDGTHAIVNSPLKGNGGAVQIDGDTASGFDLIVQNGAGTYNSMLVKEGSGISWGPGNSAPSGTYISDTSQICTVSGTNCPASPTYTSVTTGAMSNTGGIYGGQKTTTVSALSTDYLMAGTGASNGVLHVRDNTSGGSAMFLIDPNGGVQLIGTSGITGLSAASIGWNHGCSGCSGNWSISLASGTTPRTLTWTLLY